jgi:hypothetical protein
MVPFMMLHWVCNDNTCALTLAERYLRKKVYGDNVEEDCITCKLIEPVYDFRSNYRNFSIIIYVLTFILMGISFSKLYYKWNIGLIQNKADLFKLF